ncbi:MAG TPA: chlorite dismutase family protein [Acidimicrobiales bacterium]
MNEPLSPSVGWGVLHLFCKLRPGSDGEAIVAAVKAAEGDGHQVITFSVLGHKADLGVMAIGPDWVRLRRLQASLQGAGLVIVWSYVSLTELSEYSKGMPEEHLQARLYPKLPPDGKRAICFYPMSKRRGETDNWYALDFEERKRLMMDHGKSGRRFAGRIVQLITGSTGLDDFEWGVTLFGVHPDDLKDTVYTMRFDEASTRFAEFGPFYAGIVGPVEEVVAQAGLA